MDVIIPPDLVELAWWVMAHLLVIAVGVSVLVSLAKSLVRLVAPKWKDTPRERVALRVLSVVLGAVWAVGAGTAYPFDAMPLSIQLALGAGAGAHSEVAYRWVVSHLERVATKALGQSDGG